MSDGSQTMPAPATRRSWPRLERDRAFLLIQKWGLLVVLGIVVAGFSITIPDKFATQANFKDIVNSQPPSVLIAFAAVLVLMVGEFDLSLGATLGFCQYFVLKLMTATGLSWPAATVIALAIGAGIGLVNAGFVVGLGINSFIATIGMATVLDGLLQWVSHGSSPIFTAPPQTFQNLAQKELGGIALPVLYAAVIAFLLWGVAEYTVLGRELRATGANRRAAQLSGLRTKRSTVLAFVTAGLLSGLGGILITARVGAADATSGPSYLLPAYAAAFLGATAIKPGRFNVWGTVIAIFLVAVGITGLQLNGASSWVTPVFNGVVLLLAVTVSMFATRRRAGESSIFTRMRTRRARTR